MQQYSTDQKKSISGSEMVPPPHCGEGAISEPPADPYFLIQGNKSSTADKQGLRSGFLELSPSALDHATRIEKYARAHHRSVEMSNWILDHCTYKEDRVLATVLKECGSYLVFRNYYTRNEIRLHGMTSCKKHILCPLCAIRRGAKSVKAYLDRLEVIKKDHSQIKAFLVTFTVKNGDDLEERFNHLQKSIKNYNLKRSRAKHISGRDLPVEGNKALGAVWSYEFKRGNGSGLWHPHAHAIWLCYDAPNQETLSAEWKGITGDSHVVNVTPFYDQENVLNGFLEVFKYAVKFSSLPLDQNWEGFKVLAGRRLVASFGLFRGVDVPEELTDEPLEDLPFIELFYRYQPNGSYHLESWHGERSKP